MRIPVLFLLALLAQDDPGVAIVSSGVKDNFWTVSGTADHPDGTMLVVAVRRFERMWDGSSPRLMETPSDECRFRGSAAVAKKRFLAKMKSGPTGLYQVSVAQAEKVLVQETLGMGNPEVLFGTTRKNLEGIQDVIRKASAFLKEIEGHLEGRKPPSVDVRDRFLTKLAEQEGFLESVRPKLDLTATLSLLRDVYHHLRNAQIWEHAKGSGPDDNDQLDAKKGYFLDPDLTLGDLSRRIEWAEKVLAVEIRASVAENLEELLRRAGSDAKKLDKVRDAAKDALELLEAAPQRDASFEELIGSVSHAEEKDVEDLLASLRGKIQELVRKP